MNTLLKKNFLLVWQGHFVSAIGTQLFNVALMYWLLETTGSATTMGLVLMSSLLPVAVLSIFTGALVDRLPRKPLIVVSDLVRGLLCVVFAATTFMTNIDVTIAVAMLFAYSVIAGVASSFFGPALRAVLPEITGRKNLQRANGWMQGASSFAGTVGAAAGGFLYVLLGAPLLFLANGISFLLSALALSFADIPRAERKPGKNLLIDIKSGLVFMFRDAGLRRILVTIALMNVVSAPLTITLPMLVRDHREAGPELLGLIAASQGIGSLAAATLLGSKSIPSRLRSVFSSLSLLACAASLVAIVNVESQTLLLLLFGLYGAGMVSFNIPIQSAIQLRTPTELRGRVISASTTVVAFIIPVTAAVVGIAIDAVGHDISLIWSIAALILAAAALSLAVSSDARSYLNAT